MIAREIQHISNILKGIVKPTGSHNYTVADGTGIEHGLWSVLNSKFPPAMPWNRLKPAERGQIAKAGRVLHNNSIPYSTYANFLEKLGKGFLMHKSPMTITAFKEKASGAHHILSDFIGVINHLIYHWNKNEATIDIMDKAYSTFRDAYSGGLLHMVFISDSIAEAQNDNSLLEIFRMLSASKSIEEFVEKIGIKKQKAYISEKMEGSESQASKLLVTELRVRKGKAPGHPDPKLSKYFNKNNTLNARGLKLVAGGC